MLKMKASDEVEITKKNLFDYLTELETAERITNYEVIKLKSLSAYFNEALERYEHIMMIKRDE